MKTKLAFRDQILSNCIKKQDKFQLDRRLTQRLLRSCNVCGLFLNAECVHCLTACWYQCRRLWKARVCRFCTSMTSGVTRPPTGSVSTDRRSCSGISWITAVRSTPRGPVSWGRSPYTGPVLTDTSPWSISYYRCVGVVFFVFLKFFSFL